MRTVLASKTALISQVFLCHPVVSSQCGAEAVRLVQSMPKWSPGKQSGLIKRVKYTLPVTFKLD
jgi:hypothetical protein